MHRWLCQVPLGKAKPAQEESESEAIVQEVCSGALCAPWPFAEDDEEPDGAEIMPAARDKLRTAAPKAAGIFHQEQKQVQPSTVAACCSLPQVESPQAAGKAVPYWDEEDGSGSKMCHDRSLRHIARIFLIHQHRNHRKTGKSRAQ